ncbi:hypothetical protein ABIF39_007868 [Bradyrhizobium diazoefficiens]
MKVLLAHTPEMRRNYYGDRSLNGLRAAAEVILHEGDQPLDAAGLVRAARDVDVIVADRMTEGRGEIFPQLPHLRAFVPLRRRHPQRRRRCGLEGGRAGDPRRPRLRSGGGRARDRLHGRSLPRRVADDGGLPGRT